jgi:hypothetical protein
MSVAVTFADKAEALAVFKCLAEVQQRLSRSSFQALQLQLIREFEA